MLAMNRSYKVTMILVSIVGLVALSIGIMNETKRRSLMNYQKEVISSLSSEIDAYKELGFNEQDTVIEVTKARIAHAKEHLESLKVNTKVLFKKNAVDMAKKEKLENLLRINKEMAHGYRNEIAEYKKMGLSNNQQPLKAAKQSLAQLVVEIADLENKLEFNERVQVTENPTHEKIHKLIALNKDSLELYNKELEEYTKLGLAQTDPKMRYVRDRVINKAAEIEALEKHLR